MEGLAGTEENGGPVVTEHSMRISLKERAAGLLNSKEDPLIQASNYSILIPCRT